ncbi:T9SS type A sorting domain-containing protein [Draconibacterium sp. IB214405]|uniref:T9SS type A sorting domain-containing protein n=1 Tax=Draconibacterium sp. IB214405 TaxID=3097352 RepID=UPI002A15FE01|nr:T9SS type A sorting domain-containing protein [Draconibacterium sp. IB214405]MDX8341277.1 T9SS type A sorting domain-containing protein [Draconibacterium sp. IB214405]
MKSRVKIRNSGVLLVLFIFGLIHAQGASNRTTSENGWSDPPVAQNDTFIHVAKNDLVLTGNVLVNDYDPNGDKIEIYFAASPREAYLLMNKDGNFRLTLPSNYEGTISFDYYIKELTENEYKAIGNVFILITKNQDFDEVSNSDDMDNDNDGIPDYLDGMNLDSDGDGIPNNFDIDSDNDGITDNIEWQEEHNYIAPLRIDANKNGWDDAYDPEMGGVCYDPVDTDDDGIPDLIDKDADNDGRADMVEAFDYAIQLTHSDIDRDGLDDAFDDLVKGYDWQNSSTSNAMLTDANQNGIRDWRDLTNYFSSTSAFIYPNPASDHFQVFHTDLKYNQQAIIYIYNLAGQLQKVVQTENGGERIPVNDLQNGTYLVKVNSETFTHSQQVVIQH